VGIKITVLRDVAPCSSVEWLLHVSKQSSIFIFVFVISIYGDISTFSLHNVFFFYSVIPDYCICQETAIRGKWALKICLRMCWSSWSVQSTCSTCYHPSHYVATDTTSAAAASRKFRIVQLAENHFQIHQEGTGKTGSTI